MIKKFIEKEFKDINEYLSELKRIAKKSSNWSPRKHIYMAELNEKKYSVLENWIYYKELLKKIVVEMKIELKETQ